MSKMSFYHGTLNHGDTFLLNSGDPSLPLRMTMLCGVKGGKEMAIREQIFLLIIILTNRHFFPPQLQIRYVIPSASEGSPAPLSVQNFSPCFFVFSVSRGYSFFSVVLFLLHYKNKLPTLITCITYRTVGGSLK
jgi:hypothetical protein